jgi:hypothetical protein
LTVNHSAHRRTKTIAGALLLAAFAFFVQVPDGAAIDIVTHYIGGAPPSNLSGGGNLVGVFNAAARRWQAAYPGDFTIHLYFGWANLGDAGNHTLHEQGGVPHRELVGTILFDNSGSVSFYLDPTPDLDEEYGHYSEAYQDLGGGELNVARLLTNPRGEAAGHYDLLSAAIHEIGHALGISNSNAAFVEVSRNGRIHIDSALPYSETDVPLSSNYSGVTSHIDPEAVQYGSVMAGLNANERRLPSALDILINARISRFDSVELDSPTQRRADTSSRGNRSIAVPVARRK